MKQQLTTMTKSAMLPRNAGLGLGQLGRPPDAKGELAGAGRMQKALQGRPTGTILDLSRF